MDIRLKTVWQMVILVLSVAASARASDQPSFLEIGQCPTVEIPSGFSVPSFSGIWYRIGGLRNVEEKSVNCTVYDYQETGTGFTVVSNGLLNDFSPVTQNITLTQKIADQAQFTTKIRDKFDAEMVVVGTDYTSYACLFTCYNFRESHKVQFAWILSRTSTLGKTKIAKCQIELRKAGVPIAQLRGMYQGTNCNH